MNRAPWWIPLSLLLVPSTAFAHGGEIWLFFWILPVASTLLIASLAGCWKWLEGAHRIIGSVATVLMVPAGELLLRHVVRSELAIIVSPLLIVVPLLVLLVHDGAWDKVQWLVTSSVALLAGCFLLFILAMWLLWGTHG